MIPSANRIACGLFGLAALLSPVLCSPSQAVLSPNSVNKDACVHQNLTMNTKDGRHVVMRHGQVSLSNTTATVWSLAKVPDAPSTWFIYTTQPDDTRLYWYNSGDNLQVESSYSATPFTLKFYYEWDHTAPEVVIYTGERCFNIEQSADNRVWMSPKTQCTSVTMEPAAVPQYHSTDLMCHVNPSDPSDSSSDVSTGMFSSN
jgi:hypothetical protein